MTIFKNVINIVNSYIVINNKSVYFYMSDICDRMGYNDHDREYYRPNILSYLNMLEKGKFIKRVDMGDYSYIKIKDIPNPEEITIKILKLFSNDRYHLIYERKCKIKKLSK